MDVLGTAEHGSETKIGKKPLHLPQQPARCLEVTYVLVSQLPSGTLTQIQNAYAM